MNRCIWIVCLFALLLSATVLQAQSTDYSLSATQVYGSFYPLSKWVPLRATVRNTTSRPLDGIVELQIADANPASRVRLPMQVPAHSQVSKNLFVWFPPLEGGGPTDNTLATPNTALTIELLNSSGGMLTRQTALLRAIPGSNTLSAYTLLLADSFQEGDAFDPFIFMDTVADLINYNTTVTSLGSEQFPHDRIALNGVAAITLGPIDPDQLDPQQRQNLLDFISGGGILLVNAPDPQIFAASWLGQYLPVRLYGQHLANQISFSGQTIPFIGYNPVTEAIADQGNIVIADQDYVHVAYRTIGLGRIIFTSFPINALDAKAAATSQLWKQLLQTGAPQTNWITTKLPAVRNDILSRIIGKTVAPWGLAAGVVGGYVLLVIIVQFVLGGARRPHAFSLTLVIAGLFSLVLVVAGLIRTGEQVPMVARLATLDLNPSGGGLMQESVAYVGRSLPDLALHATSDETALHIEQTFTRGDQPIVLQQPFIVPHAGMLQESYQRLWHAQAPLPGDFQVHATAQLTEQGLQVEIDNRLPATLQSPRFVWDDVVLGLGQTLPTGQTTRAADDDTDSTLLVSGQDKLHQTILQASLPDHAGFINPNFAPPPPMLTAFVPDAAVPRLISTPIDGELLPRTQALLRLPLTFQPTPVGQPVRVPAPLVQMVIGRDSLGLPYDSSRHEWLPTQQDATYIVGFAAPWQAGVLQPTRASISIDFDAPRHSITLATRQGSQQLTWQASASAQSGTLELSPADVDENGTVWLSLKVQRVGQPVAGEIAPTWHMRWLRVGLQGQVIAPPKSPSNMGLRNASAERGDSAPRPDAAQAEPADHHTRVINPVHQPSTAQPHLSQTWPALLAG